MFDNTNTYTLHKEIVAGFTHYYVSFEDGTDTKQEVEVPRIVYLEFVRFVRRERNLRRWDERHKEQASISEDVLHNRTSYQPQSLEDIVLDNMRDEQVRQALKEMPNTQRRRIYLHHAMGVSVPQIAKTEKCSTRAIEHSISIAKEKLKKNFQK